MRDFGEAGIDQPLVEAATIFLLHKLVERGAIGVEDAAPREHIGLQFGEFGLVLSLRELPVGQREDGRGRDREQDDLDGHDSQQFAKPQSHDWDRLGQDQVDPMALDVERDLGAPEPHCNQRKYRSDHA